MKTAYSYIRWSTKSQGDKGRDSKTRQQESAWEWIRGKEANGEYILSNEVFLDAGKSASKGKHLEKDEYGQAKGELARFLQLVEQGKIKRGSVLLVDDYSRFSRLDPAASSHLFTGVIMAGIGMVFTGSYDKRVITRELIEKEPHLLYGIQTENIRSFREREERSRKIKLAKQSLFTNIKNGICQRNALPPYFTFIPTTSFNIGKYVHNENTPIVKELAAMFLQGKSLYEIAGIMNGRKIKTFKGKDWSGNGISRILANPILKGEHHGVKNFAPPIIDEQTWQRIQNRLSQNVFHGQKGDVINIFRGMCFCAECGHTMNVMANYNPKDRTQRYRYLRCAMTQQKNASSCSNKGVIRLNEMEQELFFDCLMKDPASLLDNNEREEVKELNKQITTAETKLNKITNDIKAATELIGVVALEELKVKMAKLEKERETVKGQLDTLNHQRSNIQDATHTYYDLRKLFMPNPRAKKMTHEEILNDPEEIKEMRERGKAIESVIDGLFNEYVREGIRVMLPSLISKITVDTRNGVSRFFVYNRTGKLIYTSSPQYSNRNNSDSWKEKVQAGIKKYWAKKKTKKGTIKKF